jgi:3-oxoacyl-[acyl-carrier protein] reductase
MDLALKEKVILVAASSKGLGFGIAEAVAKDGASVLLGSRNEKELSGAAEKLRREYQCSAQAAVLDVTDAASIQAWVSTGLRHFGRIDGLVVNAGGPPPGGFAAFDDEAWERAFHLTLLSAVRMIRTALPELERSPAAAILTVTSSSIKEPIENLILSNVFRSGVVSLVKSLSVELASLGIRVNNLVPGRIDTDRVRSLDAAAAARNGETPGAQAAEQQRQIPLGRYGTIEEFGSAAAFLLSPRASYITGVTLTVDGGKMKTLW